MSQANRGIITVDFRGRKMICDPQNLRQHLALLSFLTIAPLDHPCTQAAQHIYTILANLPPSTTLHLGYLCKDTQWHHTPDTSKYPSLWNASRFLAQLLHIDQQHAATRVSNHPSRITSVSDTTLGYQDQMVLLWEQGQPQPYSIQAKADTEFDSMRRTLPNFLIQYYLQLLLVPSNIRLPADTISNIDTVASSSGDSSGTPFGAPSTTSATDHSATPQLESIPEETEADLQEDDFMVTVYDTTDPLLVQAG